MSSNLKLSVILGAVDHLSAPLRRVNAQLDSLHGPARRLGAQLNSSLRLTGISQISRGLQGIGRETGALAFKLAALGGAAGFGFKHLFVDSAAEFENYKITLETFYGTSQKAQGALDWVSGFAATTPYQLGEVTRGFIELKSFGLDPMGGALKAAGDAAAAMGKPLDMATNTLASALRGQAEMLDNFGIFGRIQKDTMVFDWVDKAGKKFHKEVEKTNRDEIAKTITGIWQQKFGGSMDRLSKGFTGIVSNIQDNFTRVAVGTMESGGAFSFLKAELQAVLDKLNYLQTPQGLKETQKWGAKLRKVLGEIKVFAGEAWGKINELAASVGGFENLAKIAFTGIGLVLAGPLLLAITNVGIGLAMLTTAFAANPVLLAIGLVSAAIVLLWKNWDSVVAGFKLGIAAIADWFTGKLIAAIDLVKGAVGALWDAIVGIDGAIKNLLRFKNPFSGGETLFPPVGAKNLSPLLGKALPTIGNYGLPAKTDVGGLLTIKIDQEGRARVGKVKSNNPSMMFNVDNGPLMAGAR